MVKDIFNSFYNSNSKIILYLKLYNKSIQLSIRENGFLNFIKLFINRIKNIFYKNWEIVFVVKCNDLRSESKKNKNNKLLIDRYSKENLIPLREKEQLTKLKGGDLLYNNWIKTYFEKNCILWLAKKEDFVVGCHWTSLRGLKGFYYSPLLEEDAIILNAEVFSKFRGKGIWPEMIEYTIDTLQKDGISRIFIGCKEWNISSYKSITKTRFKKIGVAFPLKILGKNITVWKDLNTL